MSEIGVRSTGSGHCCAVQWVSEHSYM